MAEAFEESWFYAPLEGTGETVELPKEEAHHLRHVLRIRPGRPIVVTNGRGRVFLCDTDDREGKVEVAARRMLVENPAPPRLHVVLSLLKGRDSEEPVEGVCQLEIAAVHLVTTDHTQEFKGQDHGRLLERLRQKSLVALKQAKKSWLTAIHAPQSLEGWRKGHPGGIILVHPGPDKLDVPEHGDLYLLIGPEGGLSDRETRWLWNEEKASNLGLGATRIRGTHAPLVALGKLMGLKLA